MAEGNPAGYSRNTNHDPDSFWNSTGIKLFDSVMSASNIKFSDIGLDDLVGDNSIVLMSEFVQHCGRNPPVSTHTKRPYSASTLMDTLSGAVRKLCSKFRNESADLPPLFSDDMVQSWRKKLKDNHHRTLMQGEDESDVMKNIFPLPRKHGLRTSILPSQDMPPELRSDAQRVDLVGMAKTLFSSNRFTELAMLLLTYSGIGRGGEVKFLTYSTWFFDRTFNVLFAQWFQRKNLKTNPSGFVPDFESPFLCVFFVLGCYWACDDGLFRPQGIGAPNSAVRRKSKYVFQNLHNINDSSVTNKITRVIRGLVIAELRPFYSAKSCRIGAMSQLAWDPAVTYEEAVALGGWATPSNRDWYVWIYLVAIIPAILSLAGYRDPRVIPHLPKHQKLLVEGDIHHQFTSERWIGFVDNLFTVSLPEFLPCSGASNQDGGGRHRDLLHVVATVMVMHFDEIQNSHHVTNTYCQKMANAVIQCGMACGHVEAITKLQFWSRQLKEEFVQENVNPSDHRRNILRRGTIADQLNKMNENVMKVMQSRAEMQQQLHQHLQVQREMRLEISSLKTQLQAMNTFNQNIMTNVRWVMLQNRAIMRKLNLSVNEAAEASLPGAADPLEQPDLDLVQASFGIRGRSFSPTSRRATNGRTAGTDGHNQSGRMARTGTDGRNPSGPPPPRGSTVQPPAGSNVGTPSVARPSLEQALRVAAPREGSGNKKGATTKTEHLDQVLMNLWKYPSNAKLKTVTEGQIKLECLATFVHDVYFQKKSSARPKITKILQVVDCIWTRKEREDFCDHKIGDLDAYQFVNFLCQRVKTAVHLMRDYANQKTLEPAGTLAVQGMGNQISKDWTKKLPSYIPDWTKPNWPVTAACRLPQLVPVLTRQLKDRLQARATAQRAQEAYARGRSLGNRGGRGGRRR